MSRIQIFFDKLEAVIKKMDEFSETKDIIYEEEFDKVLGKDIDDLFANPSEVLTSFLDRLRDANTESENVIIEDFKLFDELTKKVLIKMMELVVKMGRIQNHPELQKQEYWWEKLKSI